MGETVTDVEVLLPKTKLLQCEPLLLYSPFLAVIEFRQSNKNIFSDLSVILTSEEKMKFPKLIK